MLQAILNEDFSAALAGCRMASARTANTEKKRIGESLRPRRDEVRIRGMRVSRVVSSSSISRAFVPPCIPGYIEPPDCLSRTSAELSAGTLDAHFCLRVFARAVPHHSRTRRSGTAFRDARRAPKQRDRATPRTPLGQNDAHVAQGANHQGAFGWYAPCTRRRDASRDRSDNTPVGRRAARRQPLVFDPATWRGAAPHGARRR